MTRFLAHKTKSTLLADLASAGFDFTDPQPFEQTSNGTDSAIYLGKIPAVTDEDGNVITPESTDYCANVTACDGITFATEIPAPSTPYNVWA